MSISSKIMMFVMIASVLGGCGSGSSSGNRTPEVGPVTDIRLSADTDSQIIPLVLSDDRTAIDDLVVSATSSNQRVVDDEGIIIDRLANQRTLQISPIADSVGETVISLTVADESLGLSQIQFTVNVVAEVTPAEAFIRDVFANDKSLEPVLINGIELEQDTNDPSAFDDLI